MNVYDVVVIGSGSGAIVVDRALSAGLKVALVDKGPLGGTCLNVGCIPSKMLLYPADVIMEIKRAKKLGITAEVTSIDFKAIMDRMRQLVTKDQKQIRDSIQHVKRLDFYEAEAHFVDEYTLEIEGKKIKGKKIFIASGARPLIPPIKGIDTVEYLTNDTILQLDHQPASIVIIGGGYIAAEYGHFLAAMGTKVTIFQRGNRLVPQEEPEISALLQKEMETRMRIYTNTEAVKIEQDTEYTITGRDTSGNERKISAEKILVAAGRKSNADILAVEKTGIKTDKKNYIVVNKYLETSKERIYAFGDAIGKEMFRHVANREADIAWHNSVNDEKIDMDYSAVPHAVFSHPQIASVGLTEKQAKKEYTILVGKANYTDVAKGLAMMEDKGFVKAIVDKKTYQIRGFHIIGPHAPLLIQEVINTMAIKGGLSFIGEGMHIHPALSEVVVAALGQLRKG